MTTMNYNPNDQPFNGFRQQCPAVAQAPLGMQKKDQMGPQQFQQTFKSWTPQKMKNPKFPGGPCHPSTLNQMIGQHLSNPGQGFADAWDVDSTQSFTFKGAPKQTEWHLQKEFTPKGYQLDHVGGGGGAHHQIGQGLH